MLSTTAPPADLEEFTSHVEDFVSTRWPAAGDLFSGWSGIIEHLLEHADPDHERHSLQTAQAWQGELYDAGLGWLTGDPAFGGAGLSAAHVTRFHEICARFDLPDLTPLIVGLHIIAPAVAAHGADELKQRYLPGLLRGDVVGCQLFSEPGAGSDLAAVRTRAVRDGDDWVISGQKVWSSVAHLADVGEAVVRTDPDAPKHKGITLFLIDMKSPGVSVRPLRQMTGGASFNEVFLDEVRVPDANRLGPLNGGWRVASTSLNGERAALADASDVIPKGLIERIAQLAVRYDCADNQLVRRQLADLQTLVGVMRTLAKRSQVDPDLDPAAAGSIGKLLGIRALRATVTLLREVVGSRMIADTGDAGAYEWREVLLALPGARFAGGTDEIQRNILSERVLRLPREPR